MEQSTTRAQTADLAVLLTHAERRVSGAIAAALVGEGTTLERWRVLTKLSHDLGRPMNEIAAHALLPPPTLTKVVDRLVADALVHRHVDPTDRRRVLVLLTARGRSLQRRLDRLAEQQIQRVLDGLETAAVADLARLLSRVIAN